MTAEFWTVVAAGASVVAAAAAIVAVAFDLHRRREDRAERRQEQAAHHEAEIKSQAQRVVAWADVRIAYEIPEYAVDPYGGTEVLWAHNTSDSPVYDVAVPHAWSGSSTSFVVVRAVLPPTPAPVVMVKWVRDRTNYGPPDEDSSTLSALTFRDAAGRWWRRESNGDLVKLGARPEYAADTVTIADLRAT